MNVVLFWCPFTFIQDIVNTRNGYVKKIANKKNGQELHHILRNQSLFSARPLIRRHVIGGKRERALGRTQAVSLSECNNHVALITPKLS
jgi:hypothetical protein